MQAPLAEPNGISFLAWHRCAAVLLLAFLALGTVQAADRQLAYLTSDLRIPFWDTMRRGIATRAKALGYELVIYSAENDARRELESAVSAIRTGVDGIILSPTNSSAAVTILKLAANAGIPVVIADIGSEGGQYVSYIASDNLDGAYRLGQLLARTMQARDWQDGRVGVVAIPQKRANGRARTRGFMKALDEAGIRGARIYQQVDFSYDETRRFTRALLDDYPDLRAVWLQGSDRYQAALDAIAAAGRKDEVLLICFDAELEFIDLIRNGTLVGAGMQQPFLIGEKAVDAMDAHLAGSPVPKQLLLPMLAVSRDNIDTLLPVIQRNVLGVSED